MTTVCFADNFVDNIRSAMEKRGWTQRQLARESGLHHQTVHRILARGMTPSIDVCEKLVIALEMKPEKIFRPVPNRG